MRNEERAQFTDVIRALAVTFNREASEPLFMGYWLGLNDLPLAAVNRATARAMHERKFMPVPAELRELAGELTPEDRAVKAWAAVQSAMRGHDYYDTVVFDDPLTTATVRHLWHDWMRFAEVSETDDEKWMRKEFERVYCSLARTGISQETARPLVGYFEQQNGLHGQAIKPPLTIASGLPALPGLRYSPPPRVLESAPVSAALLESVGKMPEDAVA
jgi:hypothetical protein